MEISENTDWDARYQTGNTGWDIGYASTPLKEYIDQLSDKNLKILIPGSGNSYEAEYLFKKGFSNVFVADISRYPLQNFHKRFPRFPKNQLLHTNFYEIDQQFDLILEQTFFCAQPPSFRKAYVDKMYQLLPIDGKLVGVLFDFPLDPESGPPYGGNLEEYKKLFSAKFEIDILERAYNSIKPRQGNELFFKVMKR